MDRKIHIAPWTFTDHFQPFDLALVSCGYELRARYIAQNINIESTQKIAWSFTDNQAMSFQDNFKFFSDSDYSIIEDNNFDPSQILASICDPKQTDTVNLLCDISSTTRRRMAKLIEALAHCDTPYNISVIFAYSSAQYTDPPTEMYPNVDAGPVLPSFAGWGEDPSLPTFLLLGLGYEPYRAIGAVDFIEPQRIIALRPISKDPRFEDAVKQANSQLFESKRGIELRDYEVSDMFSTIVYLNQVVSRYAQSTRPILLPFGPKPLALSMLLVGKLQDRAAVWRVSSGARQPPVQREPDGGIHCLKVDFLLPG